MFPAVVEGGCDDNSLIGGDLSDSLVVTTRHSPNPSTLLIDEQD